MKFRVGSLVAITILVCCVTADYEFSVTIYSYNNPENKCAACRNNDFEEFGCCDNHKVKNGSRCSAIPRTCEVELSVCRIGLGRSVTQCPVNTAILRRQLEAEPLVNPLLSFTTNGTKWDDSQLYVILEDYDRNEIPEYELIDILAVDLTVGTRISRGTLTGQFGLATIELEVSLVCTGNFYGPDCTLVCNSPPCPCDPGFTGDFCAINIDECASVDCSGRGVCSDGVNSYTCACQDGYSGANCQVNIGAVAGGVTVAGVVLLLTVLLVVVGVAVAVYKWRKRKDDLTIRAEAEGNDYDNPGFTDVRELNNPIYNYEKQPEITGTEERELKNPIYNYEDDDDEISRPV